MDIENNINQENHYMGDINSENEDIIIAMKEKS